ncbi:MAG: SGNH/GDSL hydrolase family protein, partial [Candidatus Sumerlaeota bacterium]|nr:SGNH/GDSL hydrolase family protein [Candidatus Sumerlaeota bacterium]
VRVKDKKSEIFHFDAPMKIKEKTWQEISLAIKPGEHRGSWGGGKTGKMEGPLRLTGFGFVIDKNAPAGALWIDDVSWEAANASGGAARSEAERRAPANTSGAAARSEAERREPAAAAPTTIIATSQLMGTYNIEDAKLLAPFWRSKTVSSEAILFVQEKEGEAADGKLLFKPEKILRVRSARGDVIYEEGKDFLVDAAGRRLTRTSDSRIPFLKREEFYKKKDEKQAIKFKVGDLDTWLLWMENGFHGKQVEVDYARAEEWEGFTPKFAGEALGRVIAKLKRKETVRLAVTGDSISAGGNASGKGQPPHTPPYPILVARQLEKTYGATVELVNVSVGGATADGGVKGIQKVVDAKPDLVIIAYGMNDVAGRDPVHYSQKIKQMIEAVRAAEKAGAETTRDDAKRSEASRSESPKAQFILVATSLANPEWSWTPADQFPKYRDALSALCGKDAGAYGADTTLADMTSLWRDILKRKRYHDLTGNGVNHPNDFGHRLYAQVILSLLIE